MPFTDFSILSFGGHFVQSSKTSCAILVGDIMGKICVKIFLISANVCKDIFSRRLLFF